ncbi:MAG: HU family DNA-binding protein [Candidatus Glassbacteria bacterium]|nr:HU family DNA-binding protein [Candidatus Glassbacteria bacterium]
MAKELFGQYLVRMGKVTQADIEEALLLQEVLEDTLGATALAQEMISFKQVGEILDHMDKSDESFTDAALALGLLTKQQITRLREEAERSHFRLGQLLVATTKLSRDELEKQLEAFPAERLMVPSPNVTKADLVMRVAEKTGRDSRTVKQLVESFLESIGSALADGGKVTLKNFGTFSTAVHSARKGRNPRSGKPIDIPERKVAQLKFSRSLRGTVE